MRKTKEDCTPDKMSPLGVGIFWYRFKSILGVTNRLQIYSRFFAIIIKKKKLFIKCFINKILRKNNQKHIYF